MPIRGEFGGAEPEHTYMSTFHWKPIVNGYSGYLPPSYLHRLERMDGFPDTTSFVQLFRDGVRYVIVHPDRYPSDRGAEVMASLAARPDVIQLGRFASARGEAFVFRIR
jgi:hypothetical protein